MALVLADAPTNRLQRLAQGTGALPLAFTGVDLDPLQPCGITPVGAHFGVKIRQLHESGRGTTAGADHLHPRGFGRQGAHHILLIQQGQIQNGVELIKHHHGVEIAGQGPLGDIPSALGLLPIEQGGFAGREIVPATRAHLINQVGKPLLQSLNGRIFVIGAPGPLEKPQQEHPRAFLLADPQPDGAQHHPEGRLALAFALTVIHMQLAMGPLVAACGGADPNAAARSPFAGLGARGRGHGPSRWHRMLMAPAPNPQRRGRLARMA